MYVVISYIYIYSYIYMNIYIYRYVYRHLGSAVVGTVPDISDIHDTFTNPDKSWTSR